MAHAEPVRVAVYGGGELGTAATHRLLRAGFAPFIVELARPTAVSRAVSAAYALYQGALTVDGVAFDVAAGAIFAEEMIGRGMVPVMAQPTAAMMERLAPRAYVDATYPRTAHLPFEAPKAAAVVAVGPWRLAGSEVQAVIDTRPLPSLGSVLDGGSVQEVAHDPGAFLPVREVPAPREGIFATYVEIGDAMRAGQPLGTLEGAEIASPADGYVRGLLADGVEAEAGQLLAEIDLSGDPANCFTISAWARAVAGGVLEAVVRLTR